MSGSRYPLTMTHPNYWPGYIGEEKIGAGGMKYYTGGLPARFPPVIVQDENQEEEYLAKGYVPSVSNPNLPPAHTTPPPTPGGFEEYPKWVNGVLCEDAEHEARVLGKAPAAAAPLAESAMGGNATIEGVVEAPYEPQGVTGGAEPPPPDNLTALHQARQEILALRAQNANLLEQLREAKSAEIARLKEQPTEVGFRGPAPDQQAGRLFRQPFRTQLRALLMGATAAEIEAAKEDLAIPRAPRVRKESLAKASRRGRKSWATRRKREMAQKKAAEQRAKEERLLARLKPPPPAESESQNQSAEKSDSISGGDDTPPAKEATV